MVTNFLCKCESRHCFDAINPQTGERGIWVDSKVFKRHEQDDEHARRLLLNQRAKDAQQAALSSQTRRIELAVRSSADDRAAQPPVLDPKYQIDFKRQLVASLSRWQEEIWTLKGHIQALEIPPAILDPLSHRAITEILTTCQTTRLSSGQIVRQLRITEHGRFRKNPAIKLMLRELWQETDELEEAILAVESRCNHLLKLKEEADEIVVNSGGVVIDTSHHFVTPFGKAAVIIQFASLMVVVCHLMFGLSRRGCTWLFAMCKFIIEASLHQAGVKGNDSENAEFADILAHFPKDVRSATNSFQLDNKSEVYAVCPKCSETYKPILESGIPVYQQRCNSSKYSKRCGEILLRPRTIGSNQTFLPIKPYVVYDTTDWIAGLTARKGYEEIMDSAWARMDQQSDQQTMADVFQGSAIRNFKGPDGVTHFSRAGPDNSTGRYLFSMGFDSFNPLRNIANGKRVSVSVVAITCLNLPISLRYKPENMFLAGIIPGPKEPKLDAINPYIRPIIEAFVQLWIGVKLSRTALFNDGRWVLAALVIIICDLPAARKIGGFSAHSHEYFCTICLANRTDHGFKNSDYDSWPRRTNESCRSWARAFLTAPSKKAANSSFDRSGQRFSELYALPYFDPTKHLVVDPMHNLFLGLGKEHFQSILGYYPKGSKADPPAFSPTSDLQIQIDPTPSNPEPSDQNARRGVRNICSKLAPIVTATDEKSINELAGRWANLTTKESLVYVAKGLGCIDEELVPGIGGSRRKFQTKQEIYVDLIKWRIEQPEPICNAPLNDKVGRIFALQEMEEIWKDIRNTVKPSWATSVPDDITTTSAKMKSDQWRSIMSLYLPLTLIRLWSGKTDSGRQELLHLTMLLSSAICIVTSRCVSQNQGALYLEYITAYRKELDRLFPGYELHGNHHMAMHLGEFLPLWGPAHGWWTFPFERMIGILQRLSTNYKPGEYEATMGRLWARSANFRAVLLRSSCPPSIIACADLLHRLIRPQNNNNLAESLDPLVNASPDDVDAINDDDQQDPASMPLPSSLQQLFRTTWPDLHLPMSVKMRNRLYINGISYTTSFKHQGNSNIMCHNSNIPLCIQNIIEFPTGGLLGQEKYWFAVKRHREAEVIRDPYSHYPHIRAKIWDQVLDSRIELLPFSAVETHFAKCPIRWEERDLVVIVSLSKVQIV